MSENDLLNNLTEGNEGEPPTEEDLTMCAVDSILDSDGELVSGQQDQQQGHRKRSHNDSQIHSNNNDHRKNHSFRGKRGKEKQPLRNQIRHRGKRNYDGSPKSKWPRQTATDEISTIHSRIKKSEQSIEKLKAHMERSTCPKDLRYDAKANIAPDEEFKNDIRAIRKEAERKYLGALVKYHYRRIDRNNNKLRVSKAEKAKADANRATARPQPSTSTSTSTSTNDSLPENVQSFAANLEKKIREMNVMMKKLEELNNKTVKAYPCLLSECTTSKQRGITAEKRKLKNRKHTERKRKTHKDITARKTEANKKYIKNLSNSEMTTDQINLLSRGLKFVPTPTTNETALRKQLLIDFEEFARRMRLQFIFHGKDNNIHPFYVKSHSCPIHPILVESLVSEDDSTHQKSGRE